MNPTLRKQLHALAKAIQPTLVMEALPGPCRTKLNPETGESIASNGDSMALYLWS
jgi:hypothetical protein